MDFTTDLLGVFCLVNKTLKTEESGWGRKGFSGLDDELMSQMDGTGVCLFIIFLSFG